MDSHANITKLIHVTEESLHPIHVPVVLGNDVIVVTQQDVRRTEDIRLLTYNKLTACGELVPFDSPKYNANLQNAILCACQYQLLNNPNANYTVLADILKKLCPQQQLNQIQDTEMNEKPATTATLRQQLEWNNCAQQLYTQTQPKRFETCGTNTSTTKILRSNAKVQVTFEQTGCPWCSVEKTNTGTCPHHHATSTTQIENKKHSQRLIQAETDHCCSRGCNTLRMRRETQCIQTIDESEDKDLNNYCSRGCNPASSPTKQNQYAQTEEKSKQLNQKNHDDVDNDSDEYCTCNDAVDNELLDRPLKFESIC